jgi:15-cis-phytoene synthase
LAPQLLLPLIEARETEVDGDFATLDDWRAWLLAGAGGLAVAAATALGAAEPETARLFGAAYGVAGLLRATGSLAAQATCLLPRALLNRHGLSPEAFIDSPGSPASRAALADVVAEGRAMLAEARRHRIARGAVAAVLPAVLARRDLASWPAVAIPRRLGDRLAVTMAGITGRV